MTDPVVGLRPSLISEQDVKSGRAVRSRTWAGIAGLSNHLLGRGRCLIPPTRIFTDVTAFVAGTEYAWRARCKTTVQALEREWVFTFDDLEGASTYNSIGAAATYTIEVPNGGTPVTHVATSGTHSSVRIVESVGAQAAADTELTFSLKASTTTAKGREVSVACYEVPRATLVMDGTDYGANVGELRVGSPIKSEGILLAVASASTTLTGKRGGYFHWLAPVTAGGATTTSYTASTVSGVYSALFRTSSGNAIGIPVLARKLFRTSTTGTLRVRVLGWVSVGTTTLSVRCTTSRSGTTTAAQTTSATTPTWLTAIDVTCDAEDLTTDNGLRGPDTFDFLNVEIARSAGAGTAYVAAVSCWEE